MCATVDGQCLEYLGYITLGPISKIYVWKPIKAQLFFRRQKKLSGKSQGYPFSPNTYFAVTEKGIVWMYCKWQPGLLELQICIDFKASNRSVPNGYFQSNNKISE